MTSKILPWLPASFAGRQPDALLESPADLARRDDYKKAQALAITEFFARIGRTSHKGHKRTQREKGIRNAGKQEAEG
jgi:hypothetical protein